MTIDNNSLLLALIDLKDAPIGFCTHPPVVV
jgi:hypothetical protein